MDALEEVSGVLVWGCGVWCWRCGCTLLGRRPSCFGARVRLCAWTGGALLMQCSSWSVQGVRIPTQSMGL
jgi:hypothetical protein